MDSKKLEILMTSADLGSFIKASEVVGYTQSGLTHMMDALEKEVGFPLLKRSHSGIELNENGKILKPLIQDFIRANACLENRIEELKNNKEQKIRIAAYASIAMHWMPEILYRYRRIAPEVKVDLRMVDNALEPFELLEKGEADVIFASRHDNYACEWTKLYDETLYAILPLNYVHQKEDGFGIEEFEGSDFIMPYGSFDIDVKNAFEGKKIVMNISQPKVDDETVIRMVSKGLGITIMSELMIRGRRDDVQCIPIKPKKGRELGIGLPENTGNEVILKLKECVIDYLNQ